MMGDEGKTPSWGQKSSIHINLASWKNSYPGGSVVAVWRMVRKAFMTVKLRGGEGLSASREQVGEIKQNP